MEIEAQKVDVEAEKPKPAPIEIPGCSLQV